MIESVKQVEQLVYHSYMRLYPDIPAGLDRDVRCPEYTRELLDTLGARDRDMNNIMITGSKGKGSVSVILSALLETCGCRTGLFTSPHLQAFRERIRISGKAVPDEKLVEAGRRLETPYMELEERLPPGRYLGPVGMASVLAVDIFSRYDTDFNIIELGRGARFDDVGRISGISAVITGIFPEHTGNLGTSLEEIAWNKAGVIQAGMKAVVSGKQEKAAGEIIEKEAREKGVPFYRSGEDFEVRNIRLTLEGTVFDYYEGASPVYQDLRLGMLGRFQAENAGIALFMARHITGISLQEKSIRLMLGKLSWFGRMEVLSRDPFILLDGCISRGCMPHVLEIMNMSLAAPFVAVVGIPEEKDYLGVLEALAEPADQLIMTHAKNDFLKFSRDQVNEAVKIRSDVQYVQDSEIACREAEKKAGRRGRILYVGTQSLIKDIKTLYGQSTLNVF